MSAPAIDDALLALAHPTRRRLVELCSDRERTVGELGRLTALRQPAASQHLRVLRDAGLVTVRADGNRRFYHVNLRTFEAGQARIPMAEAFEVRGDQIARIDLYFDPTPFASAAADR